MSVSEACLDSGPPSPLTQNAVRNHVWHFSYELIVMMQS